MNDTANNVQDMEVYEPPAIVVLGSAHELTLAKTGAGIDNANKLTV